MNPIDRIKDFIWDIVVGIKVRLYIWLVKGMEQEDSVAEKLLIVLTLLVVVYLIQIVLTMRMDAYEKRCAELVDKGEMDFIVGRVRESQEEDMRYFGGKSKIAKDISNYINNLMEGNLCG